MGTFLDSVSDKEQEAFNKILGNTKVGTIAIHEMLTNNNYEVARTIAKHTPEKYFLYGLGVGKPDEIVGCNDLGYSIFDCVLPTRDARHRRLYVYNAGSIDDINIREPKFYSYFLAFAKCALQKFQYRTPFLPRHLTAGESSLRRLAKQIVFLPLKILVFLDPDHKVQITGRSTLASTFAFTGYTQAIAFIDPGRKGHFYFFGFH